MQLSYEYGLKVELKLAQPVNKSRDAWATTVDDRKQMRKFLISRSERVNEYGLDNSDD